jgi:hypothetical protein
MLLEFFELFGMQANLAKSEFYCDGVLNRVKKQLLEGLNMKEGKLPVKCLGVPLISKRLSSADCVILLEKLLVELIRLSTNVPKRK